MLNKGGIIISASIRNVAEYCGMSIATVSRYLNKTKNVSQESAEKIQDAIDELGYIPNRNVQSIFKKRSGSIGLIVPSFVNPFFSELSTIIGKLIQNDGDGMIVCFTEDKVEKETEAIKMLLGYRVDGIIVARTTSSELYKRVNVPVVSFENEISNEVINVNADNYAGGKIAFNHLFSKKCKRFIHLAGSKSFSATNQRQKGFCDEAKKNEMSPLIINLERDFQLDSKDLYEQKFSEFEFKNGDGIFAFNDITAMNIISYLQENKFNIPEEIKVIGFDDIFFSSYSNPPLTTVAQSADQIAKSCYSILKKNINENEDDNTNVICPVKLVERSST